MTTKEISDRIISRIDDSPSAPLSIAPGSPIPGEILAAISEGQELASMLTLCLETTIPLTLAANGTFYGLRSQIPDFLVPLRLTGPAGRIRPVVMANLDLKNAGWQSTPGTPEHYFTLGLSFFGVTPQPVDDTVVQLTYARCPSPLAGDSFPEIPEEDHGALVDYGIYRVRLKEGSQGLARGIAHLSRFLDQMVKRGDYVRARSRAARYDVLPLELSLFDRSRLVEAITQTRERST